MYRARVEAVSGVRVRAGGKWLTCIGNKNVRVGDLVWTDGRCVYGHEQTPQQPHVITSGEDLAIPILLNDGKNDKFYIFRKGQLKEYEPESESEKIERRILNNKSGKVYGTSKVPYKNAYNLSVSAANCDNDIYTLINEACWSRTDFQDEQIPPLSVSIKRNSKLINEIALTDLARDVIKNAYNKAQSIAPPNEWNDGMHFTGGDNMYFWLTPSYQTYIRIDIPYSFIENDNNWAFIFFAATMTSKYRVFAVSDEKGDGQEPLWLEPSGSYWQTNIYYIDSSGKKEVIYKQYKLVQYYYTGHGGSPWGSTILENFTEDINENVESENLHNIKYPLQDGYYFKATVIAPYNKKLEVIGESPAVKYDIYSPQDKLLFSREGLIGTNFVVSKISSEKYLVGIRAITRYSFRTKKHNAGLYICEDGELEILVGEAGDYQCQNYLLRPMKHYKGWYEKIESID